VGESVSKKSMHWLEVILLLAFGISTAPPAAAQIPLGSFVTLGSPADPPSIGTGAGVFSINPDAKKTAAGRRAQLQGEYRFGDVLWIIAPFVGLMGTSAGAFYGYAGFGFDVNFGSNWVVTLYVPIVATAMLRSIALLPVRNGRTIATRGLSVHVYFD